jgi:hypothetical protein
MDEIWEVIPGAGQLVWRLIWDEEPRVRDFESNRDKQRPRGPREPFVGHVGLSMFDAADLALRNARLFPAHVAGVRLDAGFGFSLARTYVDSKGHHTVWGDKEALHGHVVQVRHRANGRID